MLFRVNPGVFWSTHAKERAEARLGFIPPLPVHLIYRMGNVIKVGGTFRAIKDGVTFVCKKKQHVFLVMTVYPKKKYYDNYGNLQERSCA